MNSNVIGSGKEIEKAEQAAYSDDPFLFIIDALIILKASCLNHFVEELLNCLLYIFTKLNVIAKIFAFYLLFMYFFA